MLGLALTARQIADWEGTPRHRAIGDWQVSRCLAAVGESRLALRYAIAARAECEEHGLTDLLPSAFEAIARAAAVGRRYRTARTALVRSKGMLDRLTIDKEDRMIYEGQIRETERLLRPRRRSE